MLYNVLNFLLFIEFFQNFSNFSKFSINSKKIKHYITFEIFTHLSSEIQQRIPGDPAGRIHYRFFQVLTHALLFYFHANFIFLHGSFGILGQSKMRASAHAEIEYFSAYRVGYMRKKTSKSRTYAVV